MRTISPGVPILSMTTTEAELSKLCSNAMLAAKVSMANQLALICERFGVAWAVVQPAVGLDHRIGNTHLNVTPERGFGGGCLPKDVDGLIAASAAAGHAPALLSAVVEFNRRVRPSGNG
jgi:UDPglucose 6-dehydrogenase